MRGAIVKMVWQDRDKSLEWAFHPIAVCSTVCGMLPYPSSRQPRVCARRWPALVNGAVLIACYTRLFLAPAHFWQDLLTTGSTGMCSIAILYSAELFLPLLTFVMIQPKAGDIRMLLEQIGSVQLDLQMDMNRTLQRQSYLLVISAAFLTSATLLSWIGPAVGTDTWVENVLLIGLATYSFIILNVPVMHTQFLALVLRKCFKEVNTIVHEVARNGAKGDLSVACKHFMSLYDITMDFGKVYGGILAVRYAAFLLDTISILYYVIFITQDMQVFEVTTNDVYVACNIAIIFFLTTFLGKVSTEATESLSDLVRIRTYSDNQNQVKYAESMLHLMLGPPIHVTASHFFSINNELVTSILATVTTYFIILAQFRKAED